MNEVLQLGPDDWRICREIRLAALADAPWAFGSTLEREVAFAESDWRRRLSTSQTFHGLRDGTVLATATAVPRDNGYEVCGVWAHPSARGTGLALGLITTVLDWIRARDCTRISVWVVEDNPRAERLYVKLGFHHTGRRIPLPRDPTRHEVELARDS
jgi:GNAT superfamily N-acetyltransferase